MNKILIISLAFTLFLSWPVQAQKSEYYEKIFLSEKKALALLFEDLDLETKTLKPTPKQLKTIQKRLKRKLKIPEYKVYIGKKDKKIKRYGFIVNEKGKHFPITFAVSLSPEATVERVVVMVYREKRGDGVKRRRFLNQFKQKTSKDPLEVNTDIVHITGSTISSWSVTAGVKKVVILLEELVIKG